MNISSPQPVTIRDHYIISIYVIHDGSFRVNESPTTYSNINQALAAAYNVYQSTPLDDNDQQAFESGLGDDPMRHA